MCNLIYVTTHLCKVTHHVNLVFTHVSLNDFYKRCIMQVVLNCLVCLLCLIDKSIVINFVVPYMVVI